MLDVQSATRDPWQKRRNELNHDWLKNTYSVALGNWVNVLSGAVENRSLEETFMSSRFPDWENRREDVVELVSSFENAMSPKALLEMPPLDRMDSKTKQWLAPLVHVLWMVRQDVKNLVADAGLALERADEVYRRIMSSRLTNNESDLSFWRSMIEEFKVFALRCSELGDTLSKFPRWIEVV